MHILGSYQHVKIWNYLLRWHTKRSHAFLSEHVISFCCVPSCTFSKSYLDSYYMLTCISLFSWMIIFCKLFIDEFFLHFICFPSDIWKCIPIFAQLQWINNLSPFWHHLSRLKIRIPEWFLSFITLHSLWMHHIVIVDLFFFHCLIILALRLTVLFFSHNIN